MQARQMRTTHESAKPTAESPPGVAVLDRAFALLAAFGPADASLTLDALSPHGTCAQLTLPVLPLNAHDATLPDC